MAFPGDLVLFAYNDGARSSSRPGALETGSAFNMGAAREGS